MAGRLNAKEVFERLTEMAWKTGDPGIVFLDRINRDNPNPQLGYIESTNPCVTADTWVQTTDGPRQVRHLVGRQFTALVDGVGPSQRPGRFLPHRVQAGVEAHYSEGIQCPSYRRSPCDDK